MIFHASSWLPYFFVFHMLYPCIFNSMLKIPRFVLFDANLVHSCCKYPYLIRINVYTLSAIPWSQLRNVTSFLSTWRPPCGPMSFAPMAASSRMDRGYHYLSKTILFRLFFWLTFSWNGRCCYLFWQILLIFLVGEVKL